MTADLVEHLMLPLAAGGHGFGAGVPATIAHIDQFHDDDHDDQAWWREVLTHRHDRERAEP